MKRILAIILALLMVLSLVACVAKKEEETETETETEATEKQTEATEKATEETKNDENNKEEPKVPQTEDEMLKYIVDAIAAVETYEGDITATVTMDSSHKMVMGEMNSNESQKVDGVVSFDGTNKVMYSNATNEEPDGKTDRIVKTFISGDTLYLAEKTIDSEGNEGEVSFSKIYDKENSEYCNIKEVGFFEQITEVFGSLKLADNMAEVKSAAATVIPVVVKDMYDDSFYMDNPTITYEASVKYVDGVCTLVISTQSSGSTVEGNVKGEGTMNLYHDISAKDGKIVGYTSKVEVSQKSIEGETVMQDYQQIVNSTMNFEYSFKKDAYDAFAATLPTDVSDLPIIDGPVESYEDAFCTVIVEGCEAYYCSFDGFDNPHDAFADLIRNFDTEKANVQIFKDEAMTQELTMENVTEADIFALEYVYAKITPKEGYALVINKYTERDEYSKAYKIILPTLEMFSHSMSANVHVEIVNPSEIHFEDSFVNDEFKEISVNGVKQDATVEKITVEAGKTYIIDYVEILSEKVYNAK